MTIDDFQFVRFFLDANGIDFDRESDVRIVEDDKADLVTFSGKSIAIHSPSSVSRVLFNLCYKIAQEKIDNPYKIDLLSLSLASEVHEYIYNDYEEHKEKTLPVIISGSKFLLINALIKEIVEPIIDKKIDLIPILACPCNFTDPCRIANSFVELNLQINRHFIPFTKYPLILNNTNVYNCASTTASMFFLQIEQSSDRIKAEKIVKNLLLDESNDLLGKIIKIVSLFERDAEFIKNFLSYLKSYCRMSSDESCCFSVQCSRNTILKEAQNTNSDVQIQWTHWPIMMGIIEKQLGGSHGSKRELSQLMKEIDKELAMERKKQLKKKRRSLNMEDLLEVYRNHHQTKSNEPGILYETLLKDNRIW